MNQFITVPEGFRLYAAPGICVEDTSFGDRGTIGAIAIDRLTGRKLALTAMHVFSGISEYPDPAKPASIAVRSPCAGNDAHIAGTLLRGSRNGIDAAAIDVDDEIVSNFLPSIDATLSFWRTTSSADEGQTVRMVGSHSRGVQFGRILRADVSVRSLNLSSVILVEMSALPGDSGAPLVDASNRLLGLLVGGNGTQQLFCSIAPILSALQCELF